MHKLCMLHESLISPTLSDLCWRWLDTLACQTTLLVSAAKEENAVSLWRALGHIRKLEAGYGVSQGDV